MRAYGGGTVRQSDGLVGVIPLMAFEVRGLGGRKRRDHSEGAALQLIGERLFKLGERKRSVFGGVVRDYFKH